MTGTWDLLPKRRSSTSFPRTRDRNPQLPSAWTAALGRTGRRYPAPDAPRADPTRRDRRHRQRRARWMDPGGSPHGAGPPAGRAPDRAPRRRDDPLHLREPPGATRRDAHGPVSPHLGGHGVGVGPGARGRYAPDPEGERHRRPLRPRTPPLAWGGAREGARIAGWTSSVSTASPRAPSGSPVN